MLWKSALDTVWALLRTQICCSVRFSAGLDYSFPRSWCNNDRIDKCQWVQCITLCITICCDTVNKSGQVQLVLRHTWLWVYLTTLSLVGTVEWWDDSLFGIHVADSGRGPNLRHYTGVCLNDLLSTAEILWGYSVSGLTVGTIYCRIQNRNNYNSAATCFQYFVQRR